MSRFLYLFRGGDASLGQMTPQQMEEHMKLWMAWIDDLTKTGNFEAGEPLESGGKVLAGKNPAVTDGPYAEAKDLVGGYLIVKADDETKASELAKGCPIFKTGGTVEVRPIRVMQAGDTCADSKVASAKS